MEQQGTEDLLAYATQALQNEAWVERVYRMLSRRYQSTEPALADRLAQLAQDEQQHTEYWKDFLTRRKHGFQVQISRVRFAFFRALFAVLGLGVTIKLLEMEERGLIQQYSWMIQSPYLSDIEKQRILQLLEHELRHEEEFEAYTSRFKFFMTKVATINAQLSNGLVTVVTIASGFAGLFVNPLDIVIPSLIVGLTGALSTLTGFYFFGRTQNTIKKGIIERLKITIAMIPHVYVNRVRKYLAEKKIGNDTQNAITREAERNVNYLTQVIADEAYGIEVEALSNPLPNALYACLFRLIGTLVPLIPYILGVPHSIAIPLSITMTMITLTINGFFVALAAELNIKQKILELVLTGALLAAIAFGLGRFSALLRSLFET